MTNEQVHVQPEAKAPERDASSRAQEAKQKSPFLSTAQAAYYVSLSRRTLEKMRSNGAGPDYRKHGRYVRYHIDDLDSWSAARRKSTISRT